MTDAANGASRGGAVTCFEVLAIQVAIIGPLFIGFAIGQRFGVVSGIAAGTLAALVGALLVSAFYRWSWRLEERELLELQQKYPAVYRVISVSAESPCVKADGVEITTGDYAWEAEPIFDDGRIYLQGLTEEWTVAWYAGFEAHQIEPVCQKPRSQYYLPQTWYAAGVKPPPCPYPTLRSSGNDLGRPQRLDFPFVQGVRVTSLKSRDSVNRRRSGTGR